MAQALATTLVVASLYALLGAGYVLVYRASRVLNLAQGDLLTLGGYFLFATAATFPGAPALALPLAAALSALTGVLVYVALMRPMAGHPVFAAVLVTVTLGILLRAAIVFVFTTARAIRCRTSGSRTRRGRWRAARSCPRSTS